MAVPLLFHYLPAFSDFLEEGSAIDRMEGKVFFSENKCRTSEFNQNIMPFSTPDEGFKGAHKFKKQ